MAVHPRRRQHEDAIHGRPLRFVHGGGVPVFDGAVVVEIEADRPALLAVQDDAHRMTVLKVFEGFSDKERDAFLQAYERDPALCMRRFAPGDLVCRKGEYELDLCFVLSGSVDLLDDVPTLAASGLRLWKPGASTESWVRSAGCRAPSTSWLTSKRKSFMCHGTHYAAGLRERQGLKRSARAQGRAHRVHVGSRQICGN